MLRQIYNKAVMDCNNSSKVQLIFQSESPQLHSAFADVTTDKSGKKFVENNVAQPNSAEEQCNGQFADMPLLSPIVEPQLSNNKLNYGSNSNFASNSGIIEVHRYGLN